MDVVANVRILTYTILPRQLINRISTYHGWANQSLRIIKISLLLNWCSGGTDCFVNVSHHALIHIRQLVLRGHHFSVYVSRFHTHTHTHQQTHVFHSFIYVITQLKVLVREMHENAARRMAWQHQRWIYVHLCLWISRYNKLWLQETEVLRGWMNHATDRLIPLQCGKLQLVNFNE